MKNKFSKTELPFPGSSHIDSMPYKEALELFIQEQTSVTYNIIMKDGYISVNDKPGLGVDVDETYLNEIKI